MFHCTFSNLLMIYQVKTKKITTVKVLIGIHFENLTSPFTHKFSIRLRRYIADTRDSVSSVIQTPKLEVVSWKLRALELLKKIILYCNIFSTLKIIDSFIFEHMLCPNWTRPKFFSGWCILNILCAMQGWSKILTLKLVSVHETQAYNSDAHFHEGRLLMNHLFKGKSKVRKNNQC